MVLIRFLGTFAFCLFLVGQAHACFAPPPEYTKHHADLVRDTPNIVLARVAGPSEEHQEVWGKREQLAQFINLENIKGETPNDFTIENGFFAPGQPVPAQDFDGHSQLGFWEKQLTRQWNMPDCAMRPVFLKDRTYLLFLGTPHWRAYEEIVSDDDLWLRAVRELTNDPSLATGLSLLASDWFSMAHGVFLGTISDCSGPKLKIERVFNGTFDNEWAYTGNSHSGYWPFQECSVGKDYVVVTLSEEQSPLPFYSSSVFEVVDGAIELSRQRGSEINVEPGAVSLSEIDDIFRNLQ